MQNNLNNTQSTPNTANPQNVGERPATNQGADFQQTAPADQLNNQQENLVVQSTGEPLPAGTVKSSSDASTWLWLAGIMVLLAVIIFVARLMVADDEEKLDIAAPSSEPGKSNPSISAKPVKKTNPKKTKSGKPTTKKRKKSAKKRR